MYSIRKLNNDPVFKPPAEWLYDLGYEKRPREESPTHIYHNNFTDTCRNKPLFIGDHFMETSNYDYNKEYYYKIVGETATQWKCLKLKRHTIGYTYGGNITEKYEYLNEYEKKQKGEKYSFYRFKKKNLERNDYLNDEYMEILLNSEFTKFC